MKLINKKIGYWLITCCAIFLFNCAGQLVHSESWVETKDLFNVKLNMTSAEVIQQLGEPLFVESFNDVEEEMVSIKFYYNFRTKEYSKEMLEQSKATTLNAENAWGRTTNIQFTFVDDRLIGWEEDKLTLSMAKGEQPKNGSALQYLSLLLNLILFIEVF